MSSRLARILNIALILACAWRLYHFLRALSIIRDPFQYDYEEGNILNAISRILHGQTPYPDPHALPNIINPYGPASYYLLAIPAKLFGVTFVYPRAMILLCTLLIAVLIAFALRRATGSITLGIAFAFIYVCIPIIQNWSWLLRVDLLGVLFTSAGLIFFAGDSTRHSERGRHDDRVEEPAPSLVLPAFFFALAILVKPTFIAAPAACAIAILVNRRSSTVNPTSVLLRLFILIASIAGIILASFALITHGAILTDLFRSHPDPYDFRAYIDWLWQVLVSAWPLVILASIAIAKQRTSPAVLWLIFSTLTASTSGKLGSNFNHFLEWNTALCLCAGLGFGELVNRHEWVRAPRENPESGNPGKFTTIPALIATACVLLVLLTWPAPLSNVARQPGCVAAYDFVRAQAGPNILSENVGSIVLGTKTVWVSNPFVLTQLVDYAGWSDADLVQMVRERRFDAILTGMDYTGIPAYRANGTYRFSPAFIRALGENYTAHQSFTCLDMNVVFTPKSSASLR